MSGGDFENYKFVMIPEASGNRPRERDHRHARPEHYSNKYSSYVGKYRSGSPTYGGNQHVYRGGIRQYPPSSSSAASYPPSHRGGGRFSTRSRGFVSRGAYRGGAPPPHSRGPPPFASRGAPRKRGSYRGGTLSSYRGGRSGSPSAMGRKPRQHPLPYAVSPVRGVDSGDESADTVETLSTGQLLMRMREAKESDNFDELYRLREYYRELKTRRLSSIRVRGKFASSSAKSYGVVADDTVDWELEEIECIEETFDDEDDELEEEGSQTDERDKEVSTPKLNESTRRRTTDRAVGSSSSSRSTPRQRSTDRHYSDSKGGGERASDEKRNGSAAKEATKRSAEMAAKKDNKNGRDKNDDRSTLDTAEMSSKRRRRCDESSYGEEEDEDEVEDLQFAEDAVDVEAMVKASETARPDGAEDESDFMMDALIHGEDEDTTDFDLSCEEVGGEAAPSLSVLLGAEAQRRLAAVDAERRTRLYRRLLARHQERSARVRENVEVADFRRFVPALVRALAAELPAVLPTASRSNLIALSKTELNAQVAIVLAAFDARSVAADGEITVIRDEERSEWALETEDDRTGDEAPSALERSVSTTIATILRQLRPIATTTGANHAEETSSSTAANA